MKEKPGLSLEGKILQALIGAATGALFAPIIAHSSVNTPIFWSAIFLLSIVESLVISRLTR